VPAAGGRDSLVSHPHPELGAPPPLARNGLRIVGLGGLGEIGRNMTVFEHAGRLLIVDCGVLFPEPDQPGVDLILPDFSSLEGRLAQIDAVVLTHAHEDHIGAIPYLLRERADLPLVGSRLTLALVRSKLTEHRINPVTVEVEEGGRQSFGPFGLEFFAVNHSIPDALAVAITTPAGVVLHTGDFKMDQLPLDGRLTDLGGFARLGTRGVDLLMSDSTNAEVPGIVTSERDIAPVLAQIFAGAQQRIIVACFASHVHRVQQVLDAAASHGRKVAFVGRSMVRNMGVARDLGYLRVPSVKGGLLVDPREAEGMPPDEIVLISTGSQGEPMSALSRMAGRDHPIRIAEGDTVILASSLIPGNETAVYRVINELTRWGARVVHKGNAMVHVSGHAPAGELLYVLNLVRPRNFMPVHGEWRHLRAHARLAELSGVPERNIVIAEDGVVVDLVDRRASVVGKVAAGYVYVDGLSVGEVTESSLKDRRILGEEGFVSVVIVVDSTTGKLVAGPEIHARGSGIDDASFGEVRPRLDEALARAAADDIHDAHQLGQLVRRTVGRWVNENYRRRPMIIPVVIEV
jgi:ribonuclease J